MKKNLQNHLLCENHLKNKPLEEKNTNHSKQFLKRNSYKEQKEAFEEKEKHLEKKKPEKKTKTP